MIRWPKNTHTNAKQVIINKPLIFVWGLQPKWCVSQFFVIVTKIPDSNNLDEKVIWDNGFRGSVHGLSIALSLRGGSTSWQKGVAEVRYSVHDGWEAEREPTSQGQNK